MSNEEWMMVWWYAISDFAVKAVSFGVTFINGKGFLSSAVDYAIRFKDAEIVYFICYGKKKSEQSVSL